MNGTREEHAISDGTEKVESSWFDGTDQTQLEGCDYLPGRYLSRYAVVDMKEELLDGVTGTRSWGSNSVG